jgi:hypothetical protein
MPRRPPTKGLVDVLPVKVQKLAPRHLAVPTDWEWQCLTFEVTCERQRDALAR